MKNEDINMDKIFREKLEGRSVQPPDHLWDGIKGQMVALKRRKRIAFISRIAAAAVVVFAFLAGWYFNEKSEHVMPEITQNKSSEEENEIATEQQGSSNIDIQAMDDKIINPNISTGTNNEKGTYKTSDLKVVEAHILVKTTDEFDSMEMAERFQFARLEYFDAKLENYSYSTKTLQQITKKETENFTVEQVLIADNVRTIEDVSEKETRWKMGVNIAPGYSSHSSGYSNSYAQNMTYEGTEGEGNVSGGISIQYKTRSRWSIESGVYYAQNTQASINTPQLVASGEYSGFDQLTSPSAGERYYFNTALKVADNKAVMNSAAGIIEFHELPKGAEIATNPEAGPALGLADSYTNSLLTSGEFSQVFDFVEIPLYLRYLLLDSNFDIELIGGVNAGLVVGNNAFIKNNDGNQNVGSTKDISSLNMSGTVGVGVNYALGQHISLSVEPRFSYFLNSINNNPDVDYRPYRIGIYTGLYYEF